MMFRTREDFRFHMPRELLNGDAAIVHYRLFERLLNIPIFMVSVCAPDEEDESSQRWQTFFLPEVQETLQFVGLEFWDQRKIYVILPERVTGKDRQIMASCEAIWKCVHKCTSDTAWMFETDQGSFQYGVDDPVEDGCVKTLMWSQGRRSGSSDHATHLAQ